MLIISISVRLVFSPFLSFFIKKTIHPFPSRFRLSFPICSCFSSSSSRALNSSRFVPSTRSPCYVPACTKRNNGESIGFRSCIFSVSVSLRFSFFPHSLVVHIFVTSNRGITRALPPLSLLSSTKLRRRRREFPPFRSLQSRARVDSLLFFVSR